jgi:hypothetical protein
MAAGFGLIGVWRCRVEWDIKLQGSDRIYKYTSASI